MSLLQTIFSAWIFLLFYYCFYYFIDVSGAKHFFCVNVFLIILLLSLLFYWCHWCKTSFCVNIFIVFVILLILLLLLLSFIIVVPLLCMCTCLQMCACMRASYFSVFLSVDYCPSVWPFNPGTTGKGKMYPFSEPQMTHPDSKGLINSCQPAVLWSFGCLRLFFCLFVNSFNQKVMNGFRWNCLEVSGVVQGTIH